MIATLKLFDLANKQQRILCDCGRPAVYLMPVRVSLYQAIRQRKKLSTLHIRLCGKCLADEVRLRRATPAGGDAT